jgi:hypothetical protein
MFLHRTHHGRLPVILMVFIVLEIGHRAPTGHRSVFAAAHGGALGYSVFLMCDVRALGSKGIDDAIQEAKTQRLAQLQFQHLFHNIHF